MHSNNIHTVAAIKECEKYTMEQHSIPSLELMERAGTACSDRISTILKEQFVKNVIIFCGSGNNGGDGVVIARQLIFKHNFGGDVTVVRSFDGSSRVSDQTRTNIERWQSIVSDHTNAHLTSYNDFDFYNLGDEDLIIDSMFGTGLNKPLQGIHSEIVEKINMSGVRVIAIDTPSGLFADSHTPENAKVVQADMTLTIQFMKLAFMVPENFKYCGCVEVIDAGIEEPVGVSEAAACRLITAGLFGSSWDMFNPYAHKGTFGHGLLVAGSTAMPGAAVLSATAALRGGIGKLTVHSTRPVLTTLASFLPEAILNFDDDEQCVSSINWNSIPENVNAIAIGPGIGKSKRTYSLLKDILDTADFPIVIDADALNLLAEDKTRLAFLPTNSILTPHFAEFARLAGESSDDFDRLKRAREFAMRYSVILVLKGHNTVVNMPDGTQFFNTTGNPGMATAGSGDVLTGLFLSLLSQGYTPQFTALLGTFIHGAAGDEYASEHFYKTLIASDLPKYFDKAFSKLVSLNI